MRLGPPRWRPFYQVSWESLPDPSRRTGISLNPDRGDGKVFESTSGRHGKGELQVHESGGATRLPLPRGSSPDLGVFCALSTIECKKERTLSKYNKTLSPATA